MGLPYLALDALGVGRGRLAGLFGETRRQDGFSWSGAGTHRATRRSMRGISCFTEPRPPEVGYGGSMRSHGWDTRHGPGRGLALALLFSLLIWLLLIAAILRLT